MILYLVGLMLASLPAQGQTAASDTTIMREVSINGQRSRISYRLDRQRIDAGQVLTAQGGTALDVLRAVPGVTVDADGSLSFRGSQEFLVYVDGKPSPLSGTEALQMIGAASIKDIEILTTPSARHHSLKSESHACHKSGWIPHGPKCYMVLRWIHLGMSFSHL